MIRTPRGLRSHPTGAFWVAHGPTDLSTAFDIGYRADSIQAKVAAFAERPLRSSLVRISRRVMRLPAAASEAAESSSRSSAPSTGWCPIQRGPKRAPKHPNQRHLETICITKNAILKEFLVRNTSVNSRCCARPRRFGGQAGCQTGELFEPNRPALDHASPRFLRGVHAAAPLPTVTEAMIPTDATFLPAPRNLYREVQRPVDR